MKNLYYQVSFLLILSTGICFASGAKNKSIKNKIKYEKIIYTSPIPGASYVNSSSSIIIRSRELIDPASINTPSLFLVTGSISGKHTGKIILADDQKTVIFKPFIRFRPNEVVKISVNNGLITNKGLLVKDTSFHFTISPQKDYPIVQKNISNNINRSFHKVTNINNLPSDFPTLTVKKSNNPLGGYIFLANYSTATTRYGRYLIIADNNGTPLYYKNVGQICYGFRLQPNGLITYYNRYTKQFYGMNTSFVTVDTFICGNGYQTDLHELRVLPNGNFFIIGDDYEAVNMDTVVQGGDTAANVWCSVIQELDKDKNVIFQWRSFDHFKITDAVDVDLTQPNIDDVHTNAIEILSDTSIIISSRNLSEITKINTLTGDIIWRLGGKNNQFTFINDPIRNTDLTLGFSYQHDVRQLPNGDITLFDDGDYHSPRYSRAVEYKLDEVNKTATLVWQYRYTPDTYSYALGSVQRLSNGNTFIGWGTSPHSITEVTKNDSLALEIDLPTNLMSYRANKIPMAFLDSPMGGENWSANSHQVLKWNSSGVDSLNIDFSTDGGKNWNSIAKAIPADSGYFDWLTPNINSDSCKIRISVADHNGYADTVQSDSNFTIGSPQSIASGQDVPNTYKLMNNYPNPFNPTTIIQYSLPVESRVDITIYNSLGQVVEKVVNSNETSGNHRVIFKGDNLSSGIYFDLMKAVSLNGKKSFSITKKMILIK